MLRPIKIFVLCMLIAFGAQDFIVMQTVGPLPTVPEARWGSWPVRSVPVYIADGWLRASKEDPVAAMWVDRFEVKDVAYEGALMSVPFGLERVIEIDKFILPWVPPWVIVASIRHELVHVRQLEENPQWNAFTWPQRQAEAEAYWTGNNFASEILKEGKWTFEN